jgi:hypothetical protein
MSPLPAEPDILVEAAMAVLAKSSERTRCIIDMRSQGLLEAFDKSKEKVGKHD